jgi:hypothetical protein
VKRHLLTLSKGVDAPKMVLVVAPPVTLFLVIRVSRFRRGDNLVSNHAQTGPSYRVARTPPLNVARFTSETTSFSSAIEVSPGVS